MIQFFSEFFGYLGPYSGYLYALVIVIITLIVAKIATFSIDRLKGRVAERTESGLDDIVVKQAKGPVRLGVLLMGAFFALNALPVLSAYSENISVWFTVIFSLYSAYLASKIVGAVIEWYSIEISERTKTKADEHFLPIIKRAAYGTIFGLMLLVMFGQFGIRIETLIAAMGIGGIAVALALQPTLSNFFSGVHMVMDRPLRIGDFVELDSGDKGTVMDIGWRSTKIRTFTNNIVVLPNTTLADSKIINYNTPNPEIGFAVKCGVSYGSDLEKVEKITLDVAKKVLSRCNGVKDFEPIFRYNEFGDSSINFKVVLRTKTLADSYLATHEFIKELKKRFDKEKIEIPFPQMDVHTDRKK